MDVGIILFGLFLVAAFLVWRLGVRPYLKDNQLWIFDPYLNYFQVDHQEIFVPIPTPFGYIAELRVFADFQIVDREAFKHARMLTDAGKEDFRQQLRKKSVEFFSNNRFFAQLRPTHSTRAETLKSQSGGGIPKTGP